MSTWYFRCQASADQTTYQNKNNLNKVETFLWAIQTWYTWFKWEAINHSMTFHTIQRIIWTIVKGLLTQMIVYSLPKSNRFYWELVPGPRHAKLCTERLFDRSNACGRFYWFLMPFERYITLKQRLNCRRTDVRSAYFLVLSSNFAILVELCDFWQTMRKFANYAKSQHRRISEALYKYCINFFLICSWKNSLPSLKTFKHRKTPCRQNVHTTRSHCRKQWVLCVCLFYLLVPLLSTQKFYWAQMNLCGMELKSTKNFYFG